MGWAELGLGLMVRCGVDVVCAAEVFVIWPLEETVLWNGAAERPHIARALSPSMVDNKLWVVDPVGEMTYCWRLETGSNRVERRSQRVTLTLFVTGWKLDATCSGAGCGKNNAGSETPTFRLNNGFDKRWESASGFVSRLRSLRVPWNSQTKDAKTVTHKRCWLSKHGVADRQGQRITGPNAGCVRPFSNYIRHALYREWPAGADRCSHTARFLLPTL